MSIKHLSSAMLGMILVTVTLLTGACSSAPSAEDVLATIPDNSIVVARYDLVSTLKNAGLNEKDGKYELSDDLEKLMKDVPSSVRDRFEQVLAAVPAIDAENIFFFVTDREEVALTVGLKHADAVEEALKKEFGAAEKDEDFKVFDINRDCKVAIRDNQLWVTDNVSDLKRAIERAKDSGFNAFIGPSQHLLEARTVTAVVNNKAAIKAADEDNLPEIITDYGKDFITIDLNLDGPAMTSCVSLMNADGENKFPGNLFSTLNTSVLRYVPGNTAAVIAMGKPEAELLDIVKATIGQRGYNEIRETLESIDGTSAIALQIPASASGFTRTTEWNYVALVHMSQSEINKWSDLYATNFGVSVNPAHQYNYTNSWGYPILGAGGPTLYWGNYDGYFAMSSKAISSGNSNSFAATFEGKRAAAAVVLPKTSPVMAELGLPFGVTLTVTYEAEGLNGVLKLTNTESGILESLIHLATDSKWQRKAMDSFMSSSRTSYDYDYDYDYYDDVVVEEEVPYEEFDSIAAY